MVRFIPVSLHDDAAVAALGYGHPDKRAFSRTAIYQQGWDWGPKLNSCGIWLPVHIEGWNRGENPFADIPMAAVHESGRFPQVTLQQQNDSIGQSFCFLADGKPFFAKGANWIPVHSFPILDSAQKARYRHLLCSAKAANFNMIRVWGGGIYEHDYFFDLCDSLGLMVWNDFNFSCTYYPGDTAYLDNVRREAEYQVRRLARHPCIVLWCGNNEVKNGWEDWGWQKQFGYSAELCARLERDMDTLFGSNGILAQAVRRYAPGTSYVTTSPLYGWGHSECVTHGDAHYWGVWWGEQPFEMFRLKTGRMMSEFGFQSYPQPSTLVAAGINLTLPATSNAALAAHQKHGRGLPIIDKALRQYYGTESAQISIPELSYLSQLAQAYGTGMAIEAHRMRQGHCWGSLYWQLNDCWPVASWSSIDFLGNWKALHYMVRRLFAPTIIVAEPAAEPQSHTERVMGPGCGDEGLYYVADSRAVDLAVVTDISLPARPLQVTLCAFDGRAIDSFSVPLPPLANEVSPHIRYRLPDSVDARSCYLCLKYGDVGRVYYFVYPRHLHLPSVKIQVSGNTAERTDSTFLCNPVNGKYEFTLSCPVLAKDLMVSTEPYLAGCFSDNYFDLLPNQSRKVVFTPVQVQTTPVKFTFRTYQPNLYDQGK